MENNISTIENLSLLELRELCISVLKREDYTKIIEKKENILIAETKQGLSTISTVFLIYNHRLSGENIDVDSVINSLKEIEDFKPNVVILISSHTVSRNVEQNLKDKFSIEIFDRDQLITLVDKHFPEYWTYKKFDLVAYEKYFLEKMVEKSALLNIQGLETKAKKLIDIYVKPRIYEIKDDIENDSVQLKRINENELVNRKHSCIIEGDTGSGKSTLLKEIGKIQIRNQSELKVLPIFITPFLLFNSNYSIVEASLKLLQSHFDKNWEEILEVYKILLLIDGIDEFDSKIQKKITLELNELSNSGRVRYILTTRSLEISKISNLCDDVELFQIKKFNDQQIKEFASRFFEDNSIADNLINALKDNRILERLPLTPLSLSLISLVFEKENYEIPATISDIYDNFNSLILGKIIADKRFDLINFAFRERLLSVYAIHLLTETELKPLRKSELISFYIEYFKKKSSRVSDKILEDFLEYLIKNSGILRIDEGSFVQFSHRSFLEYYASIEIFKHNRNLEEELINRFLDLNWQNVAIFYAGQSKDMPNFLMEVIKKVKAASSLEQYNNALLGMGYLLQALYQTDNTIREEGIEVSLNHSLNAHQIYQQLSGAGELMFFKKMRLPVISLMNMYFFYINFLSATLKEPLEMTFNKLWDRYNEDKNTNIGYQLLMIAAIFNSPRLNEVSYLEKLIFDTDLLSDPYLTTIANLSLYFDNSKSHKEIKNKVEKAFKKLNEPIRTLMTTPAHRLRFSNFDLIGPDKKVNLVMEGKTDVEILEKAFNVLTDNMQPYWNAKPAGNESGGANEVKFTLEKSKPIVDDDRIVIGVFDNDTEGQNQFKGLNKCFESYNNSGRVKRLGNNSIYAIKLPVHNLRKDYLNKTYDVHYFAIEHYFSDDLLEENNMLEKTGISNIYKIKSGKSFKSKFAQKILKINDPKIFENFIPLLETIDEISGVKIDYYNSL